MSLHGSNGRTINVEKAKLLSALRSNLDKHEKDYQEALVGYKNKLMNDLATALDLLEAAKLQDVHKLKPVQYNPPVSHSDEYREVIEMMELSTDTIINLDTAAYRQYFKDEWVWSNMFNSTSSLYKGFAGGLKA